MLKRLPYLLSALCLVFLSACSGVHSNPDKVVIGANLPLSGQFAPFGRQILQGMELYRREAAAHGINFEIVAIDNASEAAPTQEAFRRLVMDHHVQVVVGDYSSVNTFILKPLALKYRVPVVSPTATNDEVTARNPFIFRTCYNDNAQGRAISWYLRHHTSFKKVGSFFNLDLDGGDYSRGLAFTFTAAWETGKEKVIDIGYRSGQNDYAAAFREFQNAGVQAVFAPFYSDDVVRLLSSAEKAHFTPVLFGGDGWAEEEVLRNCPPRAAGSFFACMFADENPSPQTQAFIKLLQREKISPSMCLAQGYDTAAILASVLKPGMDGDAVREALGKVVNYPGVTGPTTILTDGNAAKQIYIKQIYYDDSTRRLEDKIVTVITPQMIK